jgi:hypothetical protein
MSDKEEFLSTQDFHTLKDLRTKAAFIVTKAEKAILESRVAELEYKHALLNAYLKYGLDTSDGIDMDDQGKIVRAEAQTKPEQTKE